MTTLSCWLNGWRDYIAVDYRTANPTANHCCCFHWLLQQGRTIAVNPSYSQPSQPQMNGRERPRHTYTQKQQLIDEQLNNNHHQPLQLPITSIQCKSCNDNLKPPSSSQMNEWTLLLCLLLLLEIFASTKKHVRTAFAQIARERKCTCHFTVKAIIKVSRIFYQFPNSWI